MTFGEMLAALYDDFKYPASPDATVVARMKRILNEGYLHLLRQPRLTGLRQGSLAFASVANQAVYGLPYAFDKLPDAITQQSNSLRLQYFTRDEFRNLDPGERSSGNPYYWTEVGLTPVVQQPASTGVWAASTAAGDTTQTVRIRGIRANGDLVGEATATLTGTARVAIGSITDYVTIVEFELSAAAVGDVSLYDASSQGNVLARIPIGQTSVQYQGIRLWPTPAAALTYTVDGQFRIVALVNDNDVPMLPPSYHEMLPIYARYRVWTQGKGDPRGPEAYNQWLAWTNRLMAYVEFPDDDADFRKGGRQDRPSWNNLGGWYPADGYGS